MKTVVIAGATGYLGRHLARKYVDERWHVRALVRNIATAKQSGLIAHEYVEVEATNRTTLSGAFDNADLVVSSLGITRQKDGLSYWDVDYQANINLLNAARAVHVKRFAYVHVLNADRMTDVELVAAKQAFVTELQNAEIAETVIAPSGFFSDMKDILAMAKRGRVWLFGNGAQRLNPIHGADLAAAVFEAIDAEMPLLDVGGPDVYTLEGLAQLAFKSAGKPARFTYLPDALRRIILTILPKITPRRIYGPAQFFLTAMAHDMAAPPFGTHRLKDYFEQEV